MFKGRVKVQNKMSLRNIISFLVTSLKNINKYPFSTDLFYFIDGALNCILQKSYFDTYV